MGRFVRDAVILSEGSALILFTSYEMLKTVYQEILPTLTQNNITVYKQGDDDRHRLLESFKGAPGSVLFATSSFWEGIDVPGEALRLVIICRLPFQVPSDPVIKARMDAVEKRGGNPFMELSLPEAVIRFKQGFGRLMRRHSDRGAVIVLDSRIVHKFYGRFFLESLPETVRQIGETSPLLESLETFLYSGIG